MNNLPTVAELEASKPYLTPVVTLTGVEQGQPKEWVIYALQPKQIEAYRLTPVGRNDPMDGPVHIGYGGAAGGGKSYLARAVAVSVAMRWPGSSFILFRETETDVKRNHVDQFLLEVPMYLGGHRVYSWNGSEMCATWHNGSKTYFGYLKHDKDVTRYQGPSFDGMCFEEATLQSWFQISWLTGNRLRSSVDGTVPFALYPSNPGGKGHAWYNRLFVTRRYRGEERPDDYAFIQAKLADNLELARRDPGYARKLDLLPEPYRSWQRDGNFAAGAGSALSQLDWARHLIPEFPVPAHWRHFGAFDWGFAHPFSFGHYVVNEDGAIFKVRTVTGVRLREPEKIDRIKSLVPIDKLEYVVAGHDCWAKKREREEDPPTIADQFEEAGILLSRANIDRKMGLAELRRVLDWTASGPFDAEGKPTEGDPVLRFFDNESNQRCLEQLEQMTADPKDPEDVLKIDADDFGEGGDDMYDETRYAVTSRPEAAASTWRDQPVNAFAREVLEHEARESRRSKRAKSGGKGIIPDAVF